MTGSPNMGLRWAAAVAVLLNIAFNAFYSRLTGAPEIATVTDRYRDLFSPPGYVFSIWGLIYLSFIGVSIAQLLPANRDEKAFDLLSKPLIISNLLCSAWILCFTHELIGLSFGVILATLFVSAYQFRLAAREYERYDLNSLFCVPFSIFFGWISVASIANFSIWAVSEGWIVPLKNDVLITIVLIVLAGALGVIVGLVYRSFVYPAVIVWAAIGIAIVRRLDRPDITSAAVDVSVICGLIVLVNIIRYFRR